MEIEKVKQKVKQKVRNKRDKGITKNQIKSPKAITLIALVITIIVLLILARSKYSYINWREWNFNKSRRCQNKNK